MINHDCYCYYDWIFKLLLKLFIQEFVIHLMIGLKISIFGTVGISYSSNKILVVGVWNFKETINDFFCKIIMSEASKLTGITFFT